jgi:hypothetical protein
MHASNFFSSKLGLVFAGGYLLVVAYAVIEFLSTPPEVMKEFGLVMVSLPWSFLIIFLLDTLGVSTEENGNRLVLSLTLIGCLLNTSILYFLGLLISRTIGYFTSKGTT